MAQGMAIHFLKFELRLLKFELNSNFVYVLDPQWQQISCALYSRQPQIRPPKSPETVPACKCCSSSTKDVRFSISVRMFISHEAAMRPALCYQVRRRHIGSINFVSAEVEPTQPTDVRPNQPARCIA